MFLCPNHRSSSKQKSICLSSYGEEILTCAEADVRGYYKNQKVISLLIIFYRCDGSPVYRILKKSLDTLTTLHDEKEYCLIQTVQLARDSFHWREINSLRWVQ